MAKLPAFQFYPSDWRKDNGVQALSYFERGVWFEILCLMHESEERGRLLLNGKPMPDEALARLLGLDKQVLLKTLTTLLDFGVATRASDGSLVNRRMLRDEAERKANAERQRKFYHKDKDISKPNGKPNTKPNANLTAIQQKPNNASSSSSSNTLSSSIEKERGGGGGGPPPTAAAEISLTLAEKKMTQEEFAAEMKRQFSDIIDVEKAIAECVGWFKRARQKPPNRLQVKKWLAEEYEDFDFHFGDNSPPNARQTRQIAIADCALCDPNGYVKVGDAVKICDHKTKEVKN